MNTVGAEIGARNEGGWTPLHDAAAFGSAKAVTALITAGAKIEAPSEGGSTPLHQAAQKRNAEYRKASQ